MMIHLPRAADQVIQKRRRILQQLTIFRRAFFLDVRVGIRGFAVERWKRQHARIKILLQQQRQ